MSPMLDLSKLEKVHERGGRTIAKCPACAEAGNDRKGEHLFITADGRFGCVQHPGTDGEQHRKRIFELVGVPSHGGNGAIPISKPQPRIVETYDYKDATGKLLFQTVRLQPKAFRQRRPDGNGGWIWNLSGIEPVLFRLPEITKDIREGLPIFFCEGEKDVLALVEHGFASTTNALGAKKWRDSYSETLRGADVIVVADRDQPGREHAQLVASKIYGIAKFVCVIELPDVNKKSVKDAADYFEAGGSADQLQVLADNAPEWTTGPAATENALPAIQDAATLLAKPIVLPPDVIQGIVHVGGKMVLGGASKSFKTWLLIDLAVSAATGAEWFNGYGTEKGRVLFVNFELPEPFFWSRVRTVCDERQLTIEPGFLHALNLRGHVTGWAQLQRQIQSGVYALVVLDPVYKLLFGRDENKAGDIASLLNEMEVLAVRTGAAVAFGAHYSKGNQASKESIDRIGGSGVFARDPDSILNFTRHEEPDCFTVEMTLRNHPPQKPFVVRWAYPLFAVDFSLNPARLKQPGRPEQYSNKDLLDLIDGPMTATEIVTAASKEFGIPRRRVFEMLAELKQGGVIKQPQKRGHYEPV